MKQRIRMIILCICLPILASAQTDSLSIMPPERPSKHQMGDFTLMASTGYLSVNSPFSSTFAGGGKIRMFLGERFSFDSELLIGKDHTQLGLGLFGIPIWLLGMEIVDDDSFDSFIVTLILMLACAEHVAYHIPINQRFELSPYVSALRIKTFTEPDPYELPDDYSTFYFGLGVELNTYFKQFIIAPFIDYNINYTGNIKGFNVGLSLGYNFTTKHE